MHFITTSRSSAAALWISYLYQKNSSLKHNDFCVLILGTVHKHSRALHNHLLAALPTQLQIGETQNAFPNVSNYQGFVENRILWVGFAVTMEQGAW